MSTYIPRGTQQATVADASSLALTQSANAVTADGSVTVADGSAPSNDEIYELAVELLAVQDTLVTKLNSVLATLEAYGLHASS